MRQTNSQTGGSRRPRRSSGSAYARIMGGEERGSSRRSGRRGAIQSDDGYEDDETFDSGFDDDDAYGSYDDTYDDRDDVYDDDYDDAYDDRTGRKPNGRSYGKTYGKTYGAHGRDRDFHAAGEAEHTGGGGRRARAAAGKSHGRKKKSKKILWIIPLILLLCFGWFFAKNMLQGRNWTIAVFGVDSRDGELEKNTRSDVIMLVNVDKKSGEVRLVSVYRDTYLRVNDNSEYNRINKAYEEGGHEQAIRALEENLNIQIDDYMTFSWAAVAKGINALGGVDLEISDAEFSMINAFITETVESTGIGSVHLTQPGMQHLDGVQAVAYGRLRLIDTDFNRTARQRKVLSLAVDKAKQADAKTLVEVAAALLPEVSTSIGIDDLAPMLRDLNRYQIAEAKGFPFSLQTMRIGKMDVVVPTTLESNVVLLHQFLFGEEDYVATQRVRDISARIASDSGLTEPGKELADFGTDGGVVYHQPEAQTEAPVTESTAAPQESESLLDGESESESETGESEGESGTEESTDTDSESEREEGTDESEENGPGTESESADERESEGAERPTETSSAPVIEDRPAGTVPAPTAAPAEPGPGAAETEETQEIGPGV